MSESLDNPPARQPDRRATMGCTVNIASGGSRSGPTRRRDDPDRRDPDGGAVRGGMSSASPPAHRVHVPGFPPGGRAAGGGERGIAVAADRGAPVGGTPTRDGPAGVFRRGGSKGSSAAPNVRRSAVTRGTGQGSGQRSGAPARARNPGGIRPPVRPRRRHRRRHPPLRGHCGKFTCSYDVQLRHQLPELRTQPPRYVVWGDGTTDEMCLGLVIVFPTA